MTPHFVGKTSLAGLRLLSAGDGPVLLHFTRLSGLLEARLGQQAGTLFAEPLVTPPTLGSVGSVSWYAASGGQPEPLRQLSLDRRERAEAQLRAVLAKVALLHDDPELGPLLRAALVIASPEHILSLGDRILLTGWGLGPADQDGGGFDDSLPPPLVLAPYMPVTVTPILESVPPPEPQAAAPQPEAPVRTVAAAAPPNPPRSGQSGARLIPAAVLVALAFLACGLWLGMLAVERSLAEHPQTATLADPAALRAAIAQQQQQNASLEQDIAIRQKALQGNVCLANSASFPLLGPDRAAPVSPAVVPPPPGAVQFQGSLASLLDQAVVLVVSPIKGGWRTGSGFFVTPSLIVTNRHVVDGIDPKLIQVTNQKLGRTQHVSLVAETPSFTIGGPDIALLRVDGTTGIQPLSLTETVQPLDEVIAAGFPGLLVEADPSFERLLNGDVSAMPQIILTDGRINAIQPTNAGILIMPHSAAVSGGNSGGPLVDVCGRVVGVNTFITSDRDEVVHANYAQKADNIITFLRQNNAMATVVEGPCPVAQAPLPAGPASPPHAALP
jgi:S1-C subfamily serine protease